MKYYGPLVTICVFLLGILTGLVRSSFKRTFDLKPLIYACQELNRGSTMAEHTELLKTLERTNRPLLACAWA